MRFQSRDLVMDVYATGKWALPQEPECRACSATPARPDNPTGCPPPTKPGPGPGPQGPKRCEKATARTPPKKTAPLDLLRRQLRAELTARG